MREVAMYGITAFGGYLPRLRLDRGAVYEAMGWFAPALAMVAQGERTFGNWDEDALTLAVAAARDCLTGVDRATVDAVYLGSTTMPFADRLCSGVVKEALHLPDAVGTADFGTSQRAGTTALVTALSTVRSGDRRRVLVAASDQRLTKAGTFYEQWYGDGAAAVLVGEGDAVVAEHLGSHTLSVDFVDHFRGAGRATDYTWEERWVRDEGYAKILPQAIATLLGNLGLAAADVARFIYPCVFKAEHAAIGRKLGATPAQLADTLHDVCGETGTAHPLVMLCQALETAKPGDVLVVAGFGQGADVLAFRVTDAITALPPRTGIGGHLARRVASRAYPKFLAFRGLLDTDAGIRGEAPTQTALTTLYRRRDLLHGLVGGRCTACGTPQLPRTDVCVNPACRAHHTQEPYPFAERTAVIRSFTADLLSVCPDPPAIYGLVEFPEGGRFMADFTDCSRDDVAVGQEVTLAFRKRYTDEARGFTGYFWKAVPVPRPVVKTEPAGIRLDGKVALVTGAGAGLGRAYALELARRGAAVVVNDLGGGKDGNGGSASAAAAVVAEIAAAGGRAVANHDSVATAAGGAAMVQAAIDAFGRLDIVINNAGILRDRSLVKLTDADLGAVLAVHLHGAFHVTRAALPHLRAAGAGRVILTTSAAGLYGNFGQTNYAAAKLGLVGFMNALELEGERHGILVNTVAPLARTRLTEEMLPPDLAERMQPEHVVPLVVYLASDRCTTTGEVFNAGLGFFSRAAIVAGKGAVVGDGQTPPSVAEIHRRFAAIDSLAGAREFPDATSALMAMLEAFEATKG
jgi:3-hydroxy-3-methylglutaryl CoA synthase/NAD(P)-dependent dehydrogenase (short-subunit alcohol dehydrogenase family)